MNAHTYDRGGAPDGTLGISIDRFYGDDLVCLELEDGGSAAHLTAAQARAVAEDLVAHADALDEMAP
jgi:hypothetical protein